MEAIIGGSTDPFSDPLLFRLSSQNGAAAKT
jgi:hypothetical protein